MELTPGERLIINLVINMQTELSVLRDLYVNASIAHLKPDDPELAGFLRMLEEEGTEKRKEISAQIKNLYSPGLGNIDDLLKQVLG